MTTIQEYRADEMMASDSMERNLSYQFQAIWPKERQVFEKLGLQRARSAVDLGCGTGLMAGTLAETYPMKQVIGLDLIPQRVAKASKHFSSCSNLAFVAGNASATPFSDGSFDLTISRHVLQAVPEPQLFIEEMRRITRPGGSLYILGEDYGMIHSSREPLDGEWRRISTHLQTSLGCDFFIGHRLPHRLGMMGFEDVRADLISVNTDNTDRFLLAAIFEEWRIHLGEFLLEHDVLTQEENDRFFAKHLDTILDPKATFAWNIPIISAKVPG